MRVATWNINGMRARLGELCDTLFDCVVRFHEGHSHCSAWALLLLLDNDRMELFQTGLERVAAFQTDYTLSDLDRTGTRATVLALQYLAARKRGDAAGADRLRGEIASTRWFHVAVGRSLYNILSASGI